jgi:hypothetical protein
MFTVPRMQLKYDAAARNNGEHRRQQQADAERRHEHARQPFALDVGQPAQDDADRHHAGDAHLQQGDDEVHQAASLS